MTDTMAPKRATALVAVFVLLTAALLATVWFARPDTARATAHSTMPHSRAIEAKTGIRILSAHVVGDGGIVDVRYQVLNPAKVRIVEGDSNQVPALVDPASGKSLQVTAAMRKGHERRPAGTYALIYYNKDGLVKSGDFINITIQGQTLTHVPVT